MRGEKERRESVSQSVFSLFKSYRVPLVRLSKISVSLRRQFSCQETLAPSPRLSWGHPIAREGRLYNTEPNLVVRL